MHYQKLYKKTSTGALQVWWIEREAGRYRMHSGKHGGAIVVSEWTVAVPKNEGRSNATTSAQQAELETEAAYTLKRKRGYCDTPEEATASERFSPMLAYDFKDHKKLVDQQFMAGTGVLLQPKLDGIRCIANASGLWSRDGNPIVAVPHIWEALGDIFEHNPELILDGELYNHDLKADFPALVSLVKKQKPTPADFEAARVMQYWVYDSACEGVGWERVDHAHAAVNYSHQFLEALVPVETRECHSYFDMDQVYEGYIEAGYEGMMIRVNAEYQANKRTKYLLKRKVWMSEEFIVLDIVPGVGNKSSMAASALLQLPNGKTSSATVKGSFAYCREVLAERKLLLGKKATVEFFNYTPDGKLRFPRVKVFHKEARM